MELLLKIIWSLVELSKLKHADKLLCPKKYYRPGHLLCYDLDLPNANCKVKERERNKHALALSVF